MLFYSAPFNLFRSTGSSGAASLDSSNRSLKVLRRPVEITEVKRTKMTDNGRLTLHRNGTASVYIRDPWGNAVEIIKANS